MDQGCRRATGQRAADGLGIRDIDIEWTRVRAEQLEQMTADEALSACDRIGPLTALDPSSALCQEFVAELSVAPCRASELPSVLTG